MDKEEHSKQLRRALAQAGMSQGDLGLALGVSTRTVVNWTSKSSPTMPSEVMQENLSRLLPGYADGGDAVEAAISRSELAPWRRAALLADYLRHLADQARDESG